MSWQPAEPELWAQARTTIEGDGILGHKFLLFMDTWLDRIEALTHSGSMPIGPALRMALVDTEKALGIIDTGLLGEIMTAIGLYWQHRDDFIKALSPIEIRLAGDALSAKLAQANVDQRERTKHVMDAARRGEIDKSQLPGLLAPTTDSQDTADEYAAERRQMDHEREAERTGPRLIEEWVQGPTTPIGRDPDGRRDFVINVEHAKVVTIDDEHASVGPFEIVHDHSVGEDFAYTPPPPDVEIDRTDPDPAHHRIWWSRASRWVYPGEPEYDALDAGREPVDEESAIFEGANREGISVAEYIAKHDL